MLISFAQRLRKLSTLAGDLALRTVPQRLAGLLLEQAQAAEGGDAPSRMTQREMAAQLGTVREVVARALGQLEQQGLISLSRGRISIRDAQKPERSGRNVAKVTATWGTSDYDRDRSGKRD